MTKPNFKLDETPRECIVYISQAELYRALKGIHVGNHPEAYKILASLTQAHNRSVTGGKKTIDLKGAGEALQEAVAAFSISAKEASRNLTQVVRAYRESLELQSTGVTPPPYEEMPKGLSRDREMTLHASYCIEGETPTCTETHPCQECLAMSNVYLIPKGTPLEYVRQLGGEPPKKEEDWE